MVFFGGEDFYGFFIDKLDIIVMIVVVVLVMLLIVFS